MDAFASTNEAPVLALRRSAVGEPRIPRERNSDAPAIGQINQRIDGDLNSLSKCRPVLNW